MLLRIVRHGESEGNLAGTLQGARVDQPLSPRGKGQAVSLAIRLAGEDIDSVFASPMMRARETAEVVAAPHGLGVSVDPDLVEFDWGVWCGRPLTQELDKEVSVIRKRWRSGEVEAAPAGGETPVGAGRRASRFLSRLVASGVQAPLVVAHGRFNRILMATLLGRPLSRMDDIRQRNASLSVFTWSGEGAATPLLLDDVGHIPPEQQTDSVLSDSTK